MGSTFAGVILDFDGTILDTEWSEYVTVRDEFRRHGHDYPLEVHRAGVGRADNRHWAEVLVELTGPLPDLQVVKDRRRAAHRAMIEATDVRPGIVELIGRANGSAKGLAVASSSPIDWVDPHLRRLDLRSSFQHVATGDAVERAKPWPDVFLLAAGRLGLRPEQCLAIEDSENGVAAAKTAGMTCVAVPNAVTEGGDFSAADLVLDSLADLPWTRFGLG